MTEPVKVSDLVHDRVKTILQNGDMWSSPNAAKASAEALNLLSLIRVRARQREDVADAKTEAEVNIDPVPKTDLVKAEKPVKPTSDEQPESADA